MGKLRKIFFNSVFVLLYLSFLTQFIYILVKVGNNDFSQKIGFLGLITIEWLILMTSRFMYRKLGSNNSYSGGNGHGRRFN